MIAELSCYMKDVVCFVNIWCNGACPHASRYFSSVTCTKNNILILKCLLFALLNIIMLYFTMNRVLRIKRKKQLLLM